MSDDRKEIQQPMGAPGKEDIIGGGHGRIGGHQQVTGASIYADDISFPGMLHGKILRSPHAHAKILSIDVAPALEIEGVYAVVTGQDFPQKYGIIPWTMDENALALDRVRYVGDGVAAVAAVDEVTARRGCDAIRVMYEPLEALLDPEEAALREDIQLHEGKRPGNLTKRVNLAFGDVDDAFDSAHLMVEGEYFFQGTNHAAIEPHCAIGQYETNGLMTVTSATQVPHYLHRELARVLKIPGNLIRVIQPPIGGAFGGKSEPFDLEFCVALLAKKTGRPVKILYTREEVFLAHRGRHPTRTKAKMSFDQEGMITGYDADLLLDGGAYASFGLVTTYYAGQLTSLPYKMPSYRYLSRRVYTNKPACGPKRGHGAVQPRFAIEVQLDKASRELGLDPIELRRRNFIGEFTRAVNDLRVGSGGLLTCLDQIEEASEWKSRYGKMPHGKGLGIACSAYISGTNYPIYPNDMPQSAVQICADRSGRVRVFCGASEIGQGSDTMLAAIMAQELGVALEDVRVVSADTDLTPVDLGAYSSRITLMAGHAAISAAREVSAKVRKSVAKSWDCSAKDVALADRLAINVKNPEQTISIRAAFELGESEFGTLGSVGHYNTPKEGVHGEYRGATIGATPAFSMTAHVAEVTVDEETGWMTVEKIWCAHDCGKALNPLLVEGQMEGSTYMGFGEAVMEVHEVTDDGRLCAPGLLDYRIPTSMDSPHVESLIIEHPDPNGPYGAKEAGEGPLHSSIPAICNALYDAIGIRIDELPITPEKIVAAVAERDRVAEAVEAAS
jgi:4-hydroxybenzoyl-CoA reductase alpha subunit